MPALLTSTSEPPRASAAASTIARTASGSRRSAPTTVWPEPGSAAATARAFSALRPWWTATRSPAAANARATAAPIPRDPPVTRTARPAVSWVIAAMVGPVPPPTRLWICSFRPTAPDPVRDHEEERPDGDSGASGVLPQPLRDRDPARLRGLGG